MSRQSQTDAIRFPGDTEPIGAVTILDAEGRVVRIVPAAEFRRASKGDPGPSSHSWRRRKKSA